MFLPSSDCLPRFLQAGIFRSRNQVTGCPPLPPFAWLHGCHISSASVTQAPSASPSDLCTASGGAPNEQRMSPTHARRRPYQRVRPLKNTGSCCLHTSLLLTSIVFEGFAFRRKRAKMRFLSISPFFLRQSVLALIKRVRERERERERASEVFRWIESLSLSVFSPWERIS